MDDDIDDNYDNIPQGSVKLKEGIDIQALADGKSDTFEINFGSIVNDNDVEEPERDDEVIAELTGVCMGLNTDDDNDIDADNIDINSTPFEKIAKKMTNVTEDGKIKKMIKREGAGSIPPCNSLVYIKYSSYLEYNDEPTDYTFIKKPYHFRLGNACIYGLNFAVESMKANEKSWFLIHPQYAFGKMGHPPRIPANATFLFQIELLRFVDSGPALEYPKMSDDNKRKFPTVKITVKSLLASAREYFQYNIKLAIRDYNRAISILEQCNLHNMEEQIDQQELLFKVYINLAVCYTKENLPKKACIMCNNIYSMTQNTSLIIPAKVYFHNGRALIMLGDYKRAREKLLKAQKLEPSNSQIAEELKIAINKIQEEQSREKNFAKAFISNATNDPIKYSSEKSDLIEEDNDDFQTEIRHECKLLTESTNRSIIKLPKGLTVKERNVVKSEAERAGLIYRAENESFEESSEISYYICKN